MKKSKSKLILSNISTGERITRKQQLMLYEIIKIAQERGRSKKKSNLKNKKK